MKKYIKQRLRESLLNENDDIKQKIISLIKSGDEDNIELAYGLGEGQGIDVDEMVESMYGDIIIFLGGYSTYDVRDKLNYPSTEDSKTIKEDLILLTGLKKLTLELWGETEENDRFEKFAENNNIDILSNLEYLKMHLYDYEDSDDMFNHWVLWSNDKQGAFGVEFVSKLKNLKELEIESEVYDFGCYNMNTEYNDGEDCENLDDYISFEEDMVEIRKKLDPNIKFTVGGFFNFDDMIMDYVDRNYINYMRR